METWDRLANCIPEKHAAYGIGTSMTQHPGTGAVEQRKVQRWRTLASSHPVDNLAAHHSCFRKGGGRKRQPHRVSSSQPVSPPTPSASPPAPKPATPQTRAKNLVSSSRANEGKINGTTDQYQCWGYDGFGNRIYELENQTANCPSPALTSSQVKSYSAPTGSMDNSTTVGTNNQVTFTTLKSASGGFTYDLAGNVTSDHVINYDYDQPYKPDDQRWTPANLTQQSQTFNKESQRLQSRSARAE